MSNALNWFEIPAADIERATEFYSKIFGIKMEISEAMRGFTMAQFPAEGGVGDAILQGGGYVPTAEGTGVYLNGGEDLSTVLDKVESAIGKRCLLRSPSHRVAKTSGESPEPTQLGDKAYEQSRHQVGQHRIRRDHGLAWVIRLNKAQLVSGITHYTYA